MSTSIMESRPWREETKGQPLERKEEKETIERAILERSPSDNNWHAIL